MTYALYSAKEDAGYAAAEHITMLFLGDHRFSLTVVDVSPTQLPPSVLNAVQDGEPVYRGGKLMGFLLTINTNDADQAILHKTYCWEVPAEDKPTNQKG